jgi:hypothetical protein
MTSEPTAENMAALLLGRDWFGHNPVIKDRVRLVRVTIHETDTCSATAEV